MNTGEMENGRFFNGTNFGNDCGKKKKRIIRSGLDNSLLLCQSVPSLDLMSWIRTVSLKELAKMFSLFWLAAKSNIPPRPGSPWSTILPLRKDRRLN